ncbi:MAG: ABC transporter permease [Candidatus Krumholzibacteria bacterium]|nr:ABC transporter permease [Candidatus Krumholzibacteria bacterium]
MNTILRIFILDLKRRMKSPLAIVLTMCIPLVMTLIIGSVFGRDGDVKLPRIKMLFVDYDEGLAAQFLRRGLELGQLAEMVEVIPVVEEEGERLMAEGEASAMVVIPDSFTTKIVDGVPVTIRVVKNPSESFLPIIVEEIISTFGVILDCGTNTFREPIRKSKEILTDEGWPSLNELQTLMDEAKAIFALAGGYMVDTLLTVEESTVSEAGDEGNGKSSGFNVFSYVMAGSMLIGLLFTSNIMLRDIVRERASGTLTRTLAAPLSIWHVVAGKLLAAYMVTMVASIALLIIGRFVFGMDLGGPVVLAVHLSATIFMITGLMTFCFGLIKSERAAEAIVSVLIIVISLLGGGMIPISQMGEAFRVIARFSPVYWASDGFMKIFLNQAGLIDIVQNIVILTGIGLVTLLPGTWLLGRNLRKGGSK